MKNSHVELANEFETNTKMESALKKEKPWSIRIRAFPSS
jgi:hypothetical protein